MATTSSKVSITKTQEGNDIYHYVQGLPKLNELNEQVKEVIATSSYWERHGYGLLEIGSAFPLLLLGLLMCSTETPILFIAGFLLLGCCHSVIANRLAHLAAHNSLFETKWPNRIARWLSIEMYGFFSERVAYEIHISQHHPYTNIISIGDSSSWKLPFLPRYIYMFFAPFFLPVMTPFISLKELGGRFWPTVSYCGWVSLGISFNVWLNMKLTGYTSVFYTLLFMFSYRAVTMLAYIHINIFQHIGLPMYTLKDRPSKLYQMASGVLNLHRNPVLDWIMGHTLVYCHIEHHLFPTLSDCMVLKIRPLVKKYMLDNGLPYNERPYLETLSYFMEKYEELMVKAPPFSHYVGLQ